MTGAREAWTWTFLDAAGAPHAVEAPEAHSRFDAELWLGEKWRALAADGAAAAVLHKDGVAVGAPVALREFAT